MIADNLAKVQARIQQAALRVGRDPAEITLVGVTKQQPVEVMLAGYQAGVQHFGENRVEEIVAKIPDFLRAVSEFQTPAEGRQPIIHMIGHLQSRKVADALRYAQMIHSVDSVKLAQRISRLAERANYEPTVILLQCNVSGETSKFGFQLVNWQQDESVLKCFLDDIQTMADLSHTRIAGLMTMAPIVSDPEETRPHFRSLRELLAVCAGTFPDLSWQHLSMGMTDDFEVAIEEGATMVRVGRAIFPRD
jgi:pyridoxal phosphate enzyme (YggS family)